MGDGGRSVRERNVIMKAFLAGFIGLPSSKLWKKTISVGSKGDMEVGIMASRGVRPSTEILPGGSFFDPSDH
jgi:hypothetical protein